MELVVERQDSRHTRMEAPVLISSYIMNILCFGYLLLFNKASPNSHYLHDSAIWAGPSQDELSLLPVVLAGQFDLRQRI